MSTSTGHPALPATTPGPVPAADFVVFGGTGDLAVRKLLPALYLRDHDGQLPRETRIIALSRAGLDVAGYRDTRRQQLLQVAGEAVERVRSADERVSLDPMNPFERKIVHDAVAAAGLVSESEGEEPRRHVVVLPAS